ncbi:MAG: sensor histidine kinase [Candidatus Polarisedimenticolia bacterium]
MTKAISAWLAGLLIRSGKPNRPTFLLFLLVLVSPVILVAALGYAEIDRDLTALALQRRESLAFLAAATLKADLDRLRDIGVALGTRVRFRELVGRGRWEEAIAILEHVPADFPFIEQVFLADAAGILKTDTPALPGVRGARFAHRDWYRGAMETGQAYVSEIYRRTAQPQRTVLAVAYPVRAGDGAIAGILVLQVRLARLLDWTRQVDLGQEGTLYLVDRKGHLAAHSSRDVETELLDLSERAPVRRALRGERGTSIESGDEGGAPLVASVQVVPDYGWGIVAEQPAHAAFAERDRALRRLLAACLLILLLSAALGVLLLRALVERRAAEERIAALNERLARRAAELDVSNRELEAFSYSVSHDLRAPLRAIDGFSHALEEAWGARLDDVARRHLERVRAAAQRMGRLIDDLLSLSRLGRAGMRRARVDLSAIAGRVAGELRRGEPDRRVDLLIEAGLVAEGDEGLLTIVLENLLANAWKFTRRQEAARITFGATRDGGVPAYYVRDNGAGFDMAYAGQLFGAFKRLHGETEFEGTGIGLAIVARAIHRHGGRVWAEAAVDRGATFYFTCAAPQGGRL